MRNEGRGETLFCMTILYLNNLARQSRFSDICHRLGFKVACINPASHIPRHYTRLEDVTLNFLEGFEI